MIILPSTVETVVATLHPAFAMRGSPQFRDEIRRVILRASNRARGEGKLWRPDVVFPSPDELERALDDASSVAIDVETAGLDRPEDITIAGLAPIGGSVTYAVPWTGEYREIVAHVLQSPRTIKVGHNFAFDMRAFRAYGIEPEWPVYDTIQAAALLWPPRPRRKVDGQMGSIRWLALAACVLRVIDGVPMWKHPSFDATKALYFTTWPEVPEWRHPFLYCALDAYYTGLLWLAESELLRETGMWGLFNKVVATAGLTLSRVESRGMLIDIPARDAMIDETEEQIEALEGRIAAFAQGAHATRLARIQTEAEGYAKLLIPCAEHPEYVGATKRAKCPGCADVYARNKSIHDRIRDSKKRMKALGETFKSGSDAHWRWLLFEHLGLRPVAVTKKTRLPQVDDESLIKLARKYPTIEALHWRVDLQHARHRLSGPLAFEVGADNRVRFGYSLHRTATGRIASGADAEDPDKVRTAAGNAQNLSDRDRRIFAAPEGYVLVQADWSQAEMRTEAWMARETAMLDVWRTPDGDLHSLNALDIAGALRIPGVTLANVRETKFMFGGEMKSLRQGGKTLGLALIYGLGPFKMSRMFGMPLDVCERIHKAFFHRWSRIAAFQEALIVEAETHRVVRNPFGRRIPIDGFEWDDNEQRWKLSDREAVLAYPSQSTVGDMIKAVMWDADHIPDAVLDTTTHDSLRWTVREDAVERVLPEIRATMRREWPELGPIDGYGLFVCPVDIAVGKNWGKYDAIHNPNGLREVKE